MKKTHKKYIHKIIIASLMITCILIAGCNQTNNGNGPETGASATGDTGNTNTSANPTGETAGKMEPWLADIDLKADGEFPGELRIHTWNDPSEMEMMNALIAAFNQKYPYIRVQYTQDHASTYYATMTNDFGAAVQTNDFSKAPDIYWMSQDNITSFYNLGEIMVPLTKIDEIDDSFSSDVFVDESLITCMVDETMYIMPRDFNQVVMYFNQDIFDVAGVPYPTAQMSGPAFMDMLAALRAGLDASTEVNGYGVPYKDACKYLVDVNSTWDSWVWPLAKSFGAQVVTPSGQAVLNSDETYNAVQFWRTLRGNDYTFPPYGTSAGANFMMQQSAVFIHTRSCMTMLITSTNQLKGVPHLGVTALPQFWDTYAVGSGCSGYSMYMNSQHKTEAWLFLKFMVSEEGQNALCSTGNGIPAVKSMLLKEDSVWRKFSSPNLGSAYDSDAFIYGMGMTPSPYCSTRDFFRFIPITQQSNVLQCLSTCFTAVDSGENTEFALKLNIKNQNDMIDYYMNRG